MIIRQLLQAPRLRDTLLILLGTMWPGLIDLARNSVPSLEPPLANPEDMTIPCCTANADEAIAVIRQQHQALLSGDR